jgi:hypothetical protein
MTSGLVRHGDRVRRPTGPWSPAVHEYLRHLASAERVRYAPVDAAGATASREFLVGELRWIHGISADLARAL